MSELELMWEETDNHRYFSMREITVDGIPSQETTIYSRLMFSLKSELDEKDNPLDTGQPWVWTDKWQVNEKHWLSCNVVMPQHARCPVCGKRE